ncbi:hypothetical protein OTSUT76_3160 [Orientia tsutsugamushi str. UT76]|nr:hypothetical protein OTSUT76_3160 [Orientia tsutsugamushi str. UT76]
MVKIINLAVISKYLLSITLSNLSFNVLTSLSISSVHFALKSTACSIPEIASLDSRFSIKIIDSFVLPLSDKKYETTIIVMLIKVKAITGFLRMIFVNSDNLLLDLTRFSL